MPDSTCEFPGCQRKYYARGLCNPHWQQRYKRGQELKEIRVYEATPEARFWVKVTKTDDCWLWTGAKHELGYGRFRLDAKAKLTVPSHRYAYTLLVGPIPEGMVLDHLCRNPSCVNPSHLEPVTQGENVLRGESIMANNARKTHCKYGHEFTPENTYRVAGHPTYRHCRECSLRKSREQHERKRQGK